MGIAAFAAHKPDVNASIPSTSRKDPRRSLACYNLHTGESVDAVYYAGNTYQLDALQDFNRVLRDFRTGDVHTIDPRLFNLLYRLNQRLGTREPFHIISGYRSPQTNASLAAQSDGVAKHSLHMDGEAIDIRIPGIALADVHRAALDLRGGGVGYYRSSDFVHVDVGRVRHW
jgi:uncharacterized protein YcbK (DUF882 family)